MYAIIKSGSRQYQVKPESVIEVNRLPLEAGAGFETDEVLLVDNEDGETVHVGTPYVAGAKVKGEVLAHPRDRKVVVFKMKRRKGYRRTRGHRQDLTRIRIDAIEMGKGARGGRKSTRSRPKAEAGGADGEAPAESTDKE